ALGLSGTAPVTTSSVLGAAGGGVIVTGGRRASTSGSSDPRRPSVSAATASETVRSAPRAITARGPINASDPSHTGNGRRSPEKACFRDSKDCWLRLGLPAVAAGSRASRKVIGSRKQAIGAEGRQA